MQETTRNDCFRLLATLGLAVAISLPAAAAQQEQFPGETQAMQELEEIIVRGTTIQEQIAERENEFFKLFNEINKNNDYDMNCAMVNIDPDNPGSRLMSRVCMPSFVANAVADWTVWKMRCQPPLEGFDEFDCLDRNNDNRLTWQEASARPELDARLFELDADQNGYLTRDELPEDSMSGSGPLFQPAPPDLVLMEGTEAWREHMTKVTNSDARLKEMADELGGLYYELRATQVKAYEVDAEIKAKRAQNLNSGPRAR